MTTKFSSRITSMRHRVRLAMLSIAISAAAATLWLAAQQAPVRQTPAGQFPQYRAPHMADGHPDLNGIWQAFVTANWDVQDHEAQAGLHPDGMGANGAGP